MVVKNLSKMNRKIIRERAGFEYSDVSVVMGSRNEEK